MLFLCILFLNRVFFHYSDISFPQPLPPPKAAAQLFSQPCLVLTDRFLSSFFRVYTKLLALPKYVVRLCHGTPFGWIYLWEGRSGLTPIGRCTAASQRASWWEAGEEKQSALTSFGLTTQRYVCSANSRVGSDFKALRLIVTTYLLVT